jgi:branched-chain amino acid transport system ATP-binding protein
MSLLEVQDLHAGYGSLRVVRGVSFRVEQGEFVALLGPNGAGKSTTLKALAGLLRPSEGRILSRGRPMTGLAAYEVARSGIAFVPETLNLFTGMSVYENLLLGGYWHAGGRGGREMLDLVYSLFPRLAERRRQLAGTLSGGERKMLALGRALMSNPTLMLIDEPSLGLAPKLTYAVFETLQALRTRGVTILLVEQNVPLTLQLVDRAYVLEQGTIVLEGPARDLREDAHIRTAYLGVA